MIDPSGRAARSAQQMYEDASLRGDLTDDEAAPLLAWAVDLLKAGAARPDLADDASWQSHYDALRNVIRALGKFAALRTYAPESDQQAALQRAADSLRAVGWRLDADAFFGKQAALPGDSMIKALIGILTPDAPPADPGAQAAQAAPPAVPPEPRAYSMRDEVDDPFGPIDL